MKTKEELNALKEEAETLNEKIRELTPLETTIMAKTQEELNALKEEVEAVSRKLHELTDEELEQVTGGYEIFFY